jgi:hypothetical protein
MKSALWLCLGLVIGGVVGWYVRELGAGAPSCPLAHPARIRSLSVLLGLRAQGVRAFSGNLGSFIHASSISSVASIRAVCRKAAAIRETQVGSACWWAESAGSNQGLATSVVCTLTMRSFRAGGVREMQELHNVDQRVAKIEATLQQLANVVVMTARQDERLIAIERRVDRLEQSPGHR